MNVGFPGGASGKVRRCKRHSLIPGLGRSLDEGSPFQCSCLENLKDRGTCWAPGHKESDTTEAT